jgi:predicted RNA-binding Zn-ribbon protein involved in translation (DUF1610 family)
MNFTCPKCGWKGLEEICSCDAVASLVIGIDDDGQLEYDSPTLEGDVNVLHYQCASCGEILRDDDGNPIAGEDLPEWLKSHE